MSKIIQTTDIIILASATLPGAAWKALLTHQPGLTVRGTTSTISDLSDLVKPNDSGVILLDFPEVSVDLVQQLKTAVSTYGQLILVNEYDLPQIISLLQAGAVGIMSRNASVSDLSRGLIAAGRGEIVLPPALASQALTALVRGNLNKSEPVDSLTSREKEVLSLLAKGLTNKDIAQTLFLSVRTIEAHLRNIYGKLHVATRTEAVLWAVQHGFES